MIFLSILMYIPHIHTQLPFFRLIRTGLRLFRNFFINYFFFFFMFLFSYSFSPSRMLAFFRFPLLYFSHLKKNIFFSKKTHAYSRSWWSYSNLNNYSSRWIDRFDGNISRIPKNVASLKHREEKICERFYF